MPCSSRRRRNKEIKRCKAALWCETIWRRLVQNKSGGKQKQGKSLVGVGW